MLSVFTAFATLALATPSTSVAVHSGASLPATPETRIELLNDRDLRLALRRLEGDHTGLAQLISIGNTRAGRSIDVLRIAHGELRPGRPAILLVAGMEGTHAWTSSLALDHARGLLEAYADDDRVSTLLDSTTIYVLARANPDGCERRFENPHAERLATGRGVDDDRDGREGEDPIADVDGDGVVLWMRAEDPEGEWILDPTDPRVMKLADPLRGERGTYKLYAEGRDSDGDELVAEDGEKNTEWHRNFPALWEEHAPRAGRFPGEEPGAKSVMDFVLTHPDISLVIAYGELDDLSAAPATMKQGKRGAESPGRPEADVKLLEELGRRYAKVVDKPSKGAKDEAGRLQTWLVQHRGMHCVSVNAWSPPAELPMTESDEADSSAPAKITDTESEAAEPEPAAAKQDKPEKDPEPSDDAKTLAWLEAHDVDAYRDWTAFEHPELGAIEIGGWMPHARIEPPIAMRDAIADEHFEFLLALGAELPRVAIVACLAKPRGADIYDIEVVIENSHLLPLTTAAARETETIRPIRVYLNFAEGDALLAGKPREVVDELAGTGGRRTFHWLIRSADPTRVSARVVTDHAGNVTRNAEVSR